MDIGKTALSENGDLMSFDVCVSVKHHHSQETKYVCDPPPHFLIPYTLVFNLHFLEFYKI